MVKSDRNQIWYLCRDIFSIMHVNRIWGKWHVQELKSKIGRRIFNEIDIQQLWQPYHLTRYTSIDVHF